MRLDRGLIALFGGATLAACAAGAGGAGAGASSLPAVECEPGVPLAATRYAASAQAELNRTVIPNLPEADRAAAYQAALEQAELGLAEDPDNPYHTFLAAQAQAGLGNYDEAEQLYDRTVELCGPFSAQVSEARIEAFRNLSQAGLDALSAGDTTTALARWAAASEIYTVDPNPLYNSAVVLAQQGRYDESVEMYRRVLERLDELPADAPQSVLDEAPETRANVIAGLVAAGGRMFQQNDYAGANEIFGMLAEMDPTLRDAWYNRALALYQQEVWEELVPVAERLVEVDPLNYNARIILFNAYKGVAEASTGDRERNMRNRALEALEAADALPVQVDQLSVEQADGTATVTGVATGASAAAGTPVTLELTFYGAGEVVGTQTVTVTAPAQGQTTPISATAEVTGRVSSVHYRVVS